MQIRLLQVLFFSVNFFGAAPLENGSQEDKKGGPKAAGDSRVSGVEFKVSAFVREPLDFLSRLIRFPKVLPSQFA